MRLASHVIALGLSRMQPCEAALPSGSERPSVPWMAIWPGPPANSWKMSERALMASAYGPPRSCGEIVERLLDEELAVRRRRRGLAARRRGSVRTSRPSRKTATRRASRRDTRRHSVDERMVWSARIQPVCPLGPPGEPDVHPAVAVLALDGAHHGKDGAHLRERPHGGDRLDHARVACSAEARAT